VSKLNVSNVETRRKIFPLWTKKKQHFIENNNTHRYTYKHLMKQKVSEKNFLSIYPLNYGLMSRKT